MFAQVCEILQLFAEVRKSLQKYAEVCRQMRKCASMKMETNFIQMQTFADGNLFTVRKIAFPCIQMQIYAYVG